MRQGQCEVKLNSRKELIREYKRTPKEMGVYRIRNTVNERSYIASSRDIRARFNRHRMNLKTKTESVKTLLAEWIEYGEGAFVFEVLDTLEPLDKPNYDPAEDLKTLESIWLEKLQPYEPDGYHRKRTDA
jgi:group I intron endonuclease